MKRLFLILTPYIITCSIFGVILFITSDRREKRILQKKIDTKVDSLSTDSIK